MQKYRNKMIKKGLAAIERGESNWTKPQVRKYATKRMQAIRAKYAREAKFKAIEKLPLEKRLLLVGDLMDDWGDGVERLSRSPAFKKLMKAAI